MCIQVQWENLEILYSLIQNNMCLCMLTQASFYTSGRPDLKHSFLFHTFCPASSFMHKALIVIFKTQIYPLLHTCKSMHMHTEQRGTMLLSTATFQSYVPVVMVYWISSCRLLVMSRSIPNRC